MILNDSILFLVLGFLTLSVALNFWLTFRLMGTVRRLPMAQGETAPPLSPGTVLTDVSLDRITDQSKVTLSTYPEHAKVLVFLNSKCTHCQATLPELRAAVQKSHDLGVLIWIVSTEKRARMKSFLQDEALLGTTLRASEATFEYLNPQGAFPYYLFVDAEHTVQAEGMLGDENWGNFMEQLQQGG